jgi:hypothetical protein
VRLFTRRKLRAQVAPRRIRRRGTLALKRRDKKVVRLARKLGWWSRCLLYVKTLDMPHPPAMFAGLVGVRWLVKGGDPGGPRGRIA